MIRHIGEAIPLEKAEKLYLQAYLLNLVLNACLFYQVHSPVFIRKGIGLFLLMAGCAFGLMNIWRMAKKREKPDRVFLLLAVFLSVMLISGLANMQYGMTGTCKIAGWSFILFFVVYPYGAKIDAKARLRTLGEIVFPAFVVWGLLEIVALIQFLLQITYFVHFPEYRAVKAQGVYYNRVFGIFVDAPMAATLSWSFFLFGLPLPFNGRKVYKICGTIGIALHWIYLVLANARSGVVLACVGLAVCLFPYLLHWRETKPMVPAFAGALLCSVALVFSGVKASGFVMVQAAKVVQYLSEEETKPEISLERTDLKGKPDITNFRAQIWGDSLNAYLDHPIFGVSVDGFIPYMRAAYPNGIIARQRFDVGNGYLGVLVYGGTAAFLVMLLLAAVQLKRILSLFVKTYANGLTHRARLPFFAVTASIGTAAMINADIFYINWANAMLFWLSLGALNAWYAEGYDGGSARNGEGKEGSRCELEF